MNTSFAYENFKTSINHLRDWDPKTQYITKNLTLKNKSRRKGCFSCLFNLFKRSKANEAIVATYRLDQYTSTFRKDLKKDAETCEKLALLNKRIRSILARDSSHHLRKPSYRNYINLVCRSIKTQLEAIQPNQDTSTPLGGRVSKMEVPKRKTAKANVPKEKTCKSSASVSPDASRSKPSKKEKGEYALPPLRSPKNLLNYVEDVFNNPRTTQEEATRCLRALNHLLDDKGIREKLLQRQSDRDADWLHDDQLADTSQTNETDKLLRTIILFKQRFPKDERAEEFKREYVTFCTTVRCQFYGDRIRTDYEEISALTKTIQQEIANIRNRHQKETATTVLHIVEEWVVKNGKAKPIGIPKWFHCTKKEYVNELARTGTVEVRHQGAFSGAYASSVPEIGDQYSSYGPYCFALSKHVEDQASSPSRLPLITNVNDGSSNPVQTPVILKNHTKPLLKSKRYRNQKHPRVWAGFQKNMVLKRTDKSVSPLAYYGNTTLCFFAYIAQNDHLDLDDETWRSLSKVRILPSDQFTFFVNIIQQTFHFTVPHAWKDARVPAGCLNVRPPHGWSASTLSAAAGVTEERFFCALIL